MKTITFIFTTDYDNCSWNKECEIEIFCINIHDEECNSYV